MSDELLTNDQSNLNVNWKGHFTLNQSKSLCESKLIASWSAISGWGRPWTILVMVVWGTVVLCGCGEIHDDAASGNAKGVQALLKHDPKLVFSRVPRYGASTPLHLAAANGHNDVVELLLTNKADVNATDDSGRTPLHLAVTNGNTDTVKLLLANQAKINTRDIYGTTPLHYAADKGHLEVVKLLLSSGANVYVTNSVGETPLMMAAKIRNENLSADVSKLLLTAGPYRYAADSLGDTALIMAARRDYAVVVKLLLDAGADKEEQDSNAVYSTRNPNLRNSGEAAPDFTYGLYFNFATVLIHAASSGSTHVVRLLINEGAKTNARDHWGHSALTAAACNGHTDVAKLLLAAGADVNAEGHGTATPLRFAESRGHKEVANLLRQHGGHE